MFLGKIIGTVVSTRKDEKLVGYKLLVVQQLSQDLQPQGNTIVAVDTVGAGPGEIVILVQGSSARKALSDQEAPVDVTVVGIVDTVEINA